MPADANPLRPAAPPGQSPGVAVILLNWNNAEDTRECLASLRSLRYPSHFVIVVDNGSKPESPASLQPLLQRPDVLLKNPANYGFARGCNVGIRYALEHGADYIWLLNNDTRVPPEALARLVAAAEADGKLGAVGAVLCDMDEPARIQECGGGWFDLGTGRSGANPAPPRPQRLDYLCGGCLLIKAVALQQTGLLDEGFFLYGEDADLGIKLRAAGWRLGVVDTLPILHRRGASTPTVAQDFYNSAAAIRLLRKHAPAPLRAALICALGRATKALVQGRLRSAGAVVAGAREGWRAFSEGRPYRLPRRYGAS